MPNISSRSERKFYDFFDGNGAVPAHRHGNGGGWVADSADVAESVYVGRRARVFGNAVVSGHARICNMAEVSGHACVRGHAVVADRAKVQGRAIIEGFVKIEADSFISTNIHIDGETILSDHVTLVDFKSCLSCPFMPTNTYGANRENPCVNCLAGIAKREGVRNNGDQASGVCK